MRRRPAVIVSISSTVPSAIRVPVMWVRSVTCAASNHWWAGAVIAVPIKVRKSRRCMGSCLGDSRNGAQGLWSSKSQLGAA